MMNNACILIPYAYLPMENLFSKSSKMLSRDRSLFFAIVLLYTCRNGTVNCVSNSIWRIIEVIDVQYYSLPRNQEDTTLFF